MKNFVFLAFIAMIAIISCNQSKPVKTIENLKNVIIAETNASWKYSAFAQQARDEGNDTIAQLFEAASKSEWVHAANHTKVYEELGEKMEEIVKSFEVKTTAENLQDAIDSEHNEVSVLYPKYIEDAKSEKIEKAVNSFTWAFNTEKKHHQFYQKTLEAFKTNIVSTLFFEFDVCPVCGNTYESAAVEDNCAFCQTSKDKFILI